MLFEGKKKELFKKIREIKFKKKQFFIRFPKMIFECNVFLLKSWKIRFENPYQKYIKNSEKTFFF